MPTAPAALSPADVEPLHAPDESTLAALLDLFDHDHDPDHDHDHDHEVHPAPAPDHGHDDDGGAAARSRGLVHRRLVRRAPGRPAARRRWRGIRAWGAEVRSRAAAWGTGPEGAHRAW